MIRPQLAEMVERIASMYDREVEMRELGRALELDPAKADRAVAMFSNAESLRSVRLALLRRAGLL